MTARCWTATAPCSPTREFAGEILDAQLELRLVDYGVTCHRDPVTPLDDSTWFLMEKQD